MNSLLKILSENDAVEKFLRREGRLVSDDALSLSYLVSAAFRKREQNIAIVASNLYIAQNIYEQIGAILGEECCLLYPVDEIFHQTNYSYSREMLAQRLYVMNRCLDGKKRVLITHADGIVRYLPDPKEYKKYALTLKKGNSYDLKQTVERLTKMSFTRVNKIDQSLQFALRGDILDIFPINTEKPVRIEFFDDEIESIRFFDMGSQISEKEIEEVEIFAASDLMIDSPDRGKEKILSKRNIDAAYLSEQEKCKLEEKVSGDLDRIENAGFDENLYRYFHYFVEKPFTILDYFQSDLTVVYQQEEMIKSALSRKKELTDFIAELYRNGLSLNDTEFQMDLSSVLSRLPSFIGTHSYFSSEEDYALELKSIPFFSRDLIHSIPMIREYESLGNKVIVCLGEKYYDTYRDFLYQKEISFEKIEKDDLPESNLGICFFDLKNGFELPEEKLVYLSKREIFGYRQNMTVFSSRYKKAIILNSFEELQIGDYIVHEENGIGRYEGIVTLTANEQTLDYLKILYANDQILYIPLQKFSTIRKYVSREGAVPRLSRIGGKDWSQTKQKIREQVDFLADRLIKLYAERETTPGFSFKADDEFQSEFERAFPYELTPDQETAVREIKADMERSTPMDRLLCGDVGFGKTEVAFRAAFKAILSGKQVALLCPTTILAKQHYDVATSRFAMFGVRIALFSRFVPEKQQKEYIRQIRERQIHLIIGTHRILSEEIAIPNLGLLIVDEEQRFGVEHKERIKEMSVHVDVLTLTATPIPRTLQMSLLGIRNLSQLQTPPNARMPIQTYVTPYEPRLAKEIIARELSRGGQVFYLHNRVSSIYQKANFIKSALPDARVGVVHAKMDKEDIDSIMTEFYLGNLDVLVCTSIVEAGLDVPNANTIIVENADTFGLSQLYQIKGRVGRSNRVAYAYLFYNEKKEIGENALRRLEAIREFTELGSGFKIAQKDLNIRGAGDILGSEQSGFIDTVGMDMYVTILSEAIREKKGIPDEKKKIRRTNVTVGGYIPSSYALDSDKIQLYQEIENCSTLASIEIFRRKIRDIYGRLPKEVEKILLKRKIDILSNGKYIESVFEEETINVTLTKEISMRNGLATVLGQKWQKIMEDLYVKFIGKQLIVKISKNKRSLQNLLLILDSINALE